MNSCSDIFKISKQGFIEGIRLVKSPNFDNRPMNAKVSLLVIHNISLPPGKYGGEFVEKFFTNSLDPSIDPFFDKIKNYLVDMWSDRDDKYSETRIVDGKYKIIKKAEMSYIGG